MRGTGPLIAGAIACTLAPSSALGAFPGRNGLLAVQPLDGEGIELVSAHTGKATRLCPGVPITTLGGFSAPPPGCDHIAGASWSPDGRELALIRHTTEDGDLLDVIYTDGSCVACDQRWGLFGTSQFFTDRVLANPSFSADGRGLFVTVGAGQSTAVASGSFYGIGQQRSLPRPASDATVSSSGVVALVRDGRVLIEHRAVASGTSPVWSPDARELAYVRDGWVRVYDLATDTGSQLVRGRAPAWSPDGRELAFIGGADTLETIPTTGGAPRRIGDVRGVHVDWQPLRRAPAGCSFPATAKVIAKSRLATVVYDEQGFAPPYAGDLTAGTRRAAPYLWTVLGCLRSSSKIRLIESSAEAYSSAGPIKFAGDEVGLEFAQGGPYGCVMGADVWLTVVDLADGSSAIHDHVANMECGDDFDHLDDWLMSPTGALVYLTDLGPGSFGVFQDQWTLIAHDGTGVRVLDSLTTSSEQAPLTELAINGDTVSWDHLGSRRSATLR